MNRYGLGLLICVSLIFALGLIMVFNTTAAEVLNRGLDRSTHHALIKQLLYAFLGGIGAVAVWAIGYQNILKLSVPFLYCGILLLILAFVPGIGQQINGAHRWIGVGGYSFQPSELMKYAIPLYYIQMVTTRQKPIDLKAFLKLLAIIAVPLALILVEPDNGTVGIILVTLVALFLLTGLRWVYWALPLMFITLMGVIVASQMPHVSDRIRIYINPELDLKGKGHQPFQAKIAAGSGKLYGKGIGESLQKLDYLPEARNDYIAAIYAEECGFIGILGLILVYMVLGFLGFYLAARVPDLPGFYVVAIFTFIICFQAFLNLGVVSGLLPSKGTNLPFFSQGGSSLLANFMAVCLILNISKGADRAEKAI
jgi:cell division protein FtsW